MLFLRALIHAVTQREGVDVVLGWSSIFPILKNDTFVVQVGSVTAVVSKTKANFHSLKLGANTKEDCPVHISVLKKAMEDTQDSIDT